MSAEGGCVYGGGGGGREGVYVCWKYKHDSCMQSAHEGLLLGQLILIQAE